MLVNFKIVYSVAFFFSLHLSVQSGLKNSVIAAFQTVVFSCFSLDNITHRQSILIHVVQFFS
jgi:hypothetical protein